MNNNNKFTMQNNFQLPKYRFKTYELIFRNRLETISSVIDNNTDSDSSQNAPLRRVVPVHVGGAVSSDGVDHAVQRGGGEAAA